ncbi:MAG: hypothetical protein CM15mP100_8120 [Alphaproteobacteria bacterium]|nr:MAG: hypothetical protein CM15mP100_8120 [Alphaproteobacteria bacterium]
MITFENVSHAYGRQQSVTDISFQIEGGQVVTLLGPSGCGKTTLLRLAAGFETPISGQVAQDGNILSSPTILVAPERRQMGLVFQSYALFPHMTIGENIRFGMKQTDSEAEIYLAELMQEMDLSDMETKFPHELSGGQQQRVALARALAPAPRLILLDEPYSGLDSRLRERVRDKMLHILRQTGTAALMVTHDAEEAMFMSDKIIVLRDGKNHATRSSNRFVLSARKCFCRRIFWRVKSHSCQRSKWSGRKHGWQFYLLRNSRWAGRRCSY